MQARKYKESAPPSSSYGLVYKTLNKDEADLDAQIAVQQAIVENRDQEIAKLTEAVEETHEIFRELAYLVNTQSEDMDSIYKNICESEKKTQQGVAELEKASEYQSWRCVIS